MAKSALSVTQPQSFRTSKELRAWLARHHARATCLLLRIYKKGSGLESITYAEALDEALCFGWIDGQKLPLDAKSWVQRFTPRKPRSGWSKRNTAHVARLIQANQMTPAGLKEVDAAKADGRWAAAYDSPAYATVPPEFTEELARNLEKHHDLFLDWERRPTNSSNIDAARAAALKYDNALYALRSKSRSV